MDYLEMSPEYAACQGPVEDDEDPEYLAFLESLNYEDCPKHGSQKIVRDDVTGGSDPYAIAVLECKDRVVNYGDGNVII